MNASKQNPVMSTYGRQPVMFERGEGVWLWDTDGKRYFDALCGIAVCGLGHVHPKVTEAICLQASQLLHTSNLYRIDLQEQLAAKLTTASGLENVFFCNSGAEANEAALKIARRFGHERGVACPTVITMNGSFHGRTMATLSATGNPKVQKGFEPLVAGFVHVPYGDCAAVNSLFDERDDIVGILVEPVQGEGGVVIPPAGYLEALREICDRHDALLMLDEVQCGMGRTGKWFAFQHENVQPDVMTLAKSLGNGVPIGACLAGPKASDLLQPGMHGSTFGGNPLACRAALAVLNAIEEESLIERCKILSENIEVEFKRTLEPLAGVVQVRTKGLMIGIELDRPCGELVARGIDAGILINVAADNVVRLLPPLVMSDDEAGHMVSKVCGLIEAFCAAN
ncbi:MAG: acetylornithine/N-succinyldiaminopimelate aminotransferase [Gammaproteobacteria bacterium]|jgi:acetylornithine/N-succinyldiaminopimelate aminotransferase